MNNAISTTPPTQSTPAKTCSSRNSSIAEYIDLLGSNVDQVRCNNTIPEKRAKLCCVSRDRSLPRKFHSQAPRICRLRRLASSQDDRNCSSRHPYGSKNFVLSSGAKR